MGALEWIGKNLIPVPGLRDVVESVGRGLSGGRFFEKAEYRKNIPQALKIEGKKIPNHTTVYMNGICNSIEEAREVGQKFSEMMNGAEVYVLYNNSNGLLADIFESIFLCFGIPTAPDMKFFEFVKNILSNNPNEIIDLNIHSQAGLHLYNTGKHMPLEMRMQINVTTFGSAKLIPNKMFGGAKNYVSSRDFVPMFDVFNYIAALRGNMFNVQFIPATSWNPLKEHCIMGKTYQGVIEQLGKNAITNSYR